MLKKLFTFILIILISGLLLWEYKVNVIVWGLPKINHIINPVQDNIPTDWSEGPSDQSVGMLS